MLIGRYAQKYYVITLSIRLTHEYDIEDLVRYSAGSVRRLAYSCISRFVCWMETFQLLAAGQPVVEARFECFIAEIGTLQIVPAWSQWSGPRSN